MITAIPGRAIPGQTRLGVATTELPGEHRLGFRFIAGTGLRATTWQPEIHRLGFRFEIGPEFDARIISPHLLGFRFIVTPEARATLAEYSHELGFRFVVTPQIRASMIGEHELGFRFVVGPAIRERYIGPGTGLVSEGPKLTVIDRARPGDSFPVHLPWAGLHGMSGLVRVLSVQIRDGQRTINTQFIPMPDEALIPGLAKGEPIRYTPPVQNDPWKLNRENQRGIRKLDRRR